MPRRSMRSGLTPAQKRAALANLVKARAAKSKSDRMWGNPSKGIIGSVQHSGKRLRIHANAGGYQFNSLASKSVNFESAVRQVRSGFMAKTAKKEYLRKKKARKSSASSKFAPMSAHNAPGK